MKKTTTRLLAAVAVSAVVSAIPQAVSAETVTFAPTFTDGAVLQHGKNLPIWGTAPAGSKLTVHLGRDQAQVITGPDGKWMVELPAQQITEETSLSAVLETGETKTLDNIAIGDVWLCSGQSNMEFAVRQATNGESEIGAASDAGLRLFHIPRHSAAKPENTFSAPVQWHAATPETVKDFSAACYFMGRNLRREQDIPIGLIAASWGGSIIQEWISERAMQETGLHQQGLELLSLYARAPNKAKKAYRDLIVDWVHKEAQNGTEWSPPVSMPQNTGFWEAWGHDDFNTFDGIARYDIELTLTPEQLKKAEAIIIGRVDDTDISSINGNILGSTTGWDQLRTYSVTAQVLEPGVNKLSVTVVDTGGGGGIWGPEEKGLRLKDGTLIPFKGDWQIRRGPALTLKNRPPILPWQAAAGLTTLYNGMIHPLGPYRVRGYAWYQGESNVFEAARYKTLLPALIKDWRSRMGGSDFLVIQLAGYGPLESKPFDFPWAQLREAQRLTVVNDHKSALIPAIDIGDPYDIHPSNKSELGRRMALAVTSTDGANRIGTNISASVNADIVELSLDRPYEVLGGTENPVGFELCNNRKECRFVQADLTNSHTVTLKHQATDIEVRYLWANSPVVTLYDRNGVPLPPFRLPLPRE